MRHYVLKKLFVYSLILFFSIIIIIQILSAFNQQNTENNVENLLSFENNIKLNADTSVIELLEDAGEYSFYHGGAIKGTIPSIWPIEKGYISSTFGYRYTVFTRNRAFHSGLDISAPKDSKIFAAGDGVVVYAGFRGSYGYTVIIAHNYKYSTWYAHCKKIIVERGMKVNSGQVIAIVGSTGNSTGTHLHYEVRYDNIPRNPLDYIGLRR